MVGFHYRIVKWQSLKLDSVFSLFLQNKWLRSISQAVDQVLGGGGEGSSPEVMGISRTASYRFTGEGRFKDAHYTGGWFAGRVHGRLESVFVCVYLYSYVRENQLDFKTVGIFCPCFLTDL